MAKGHKPVAGSRAFWPKKRAKRIYPRFKAAQAKEVKPLGFAGYKAGMTQVLFLDTRPDSITHGQEIIKPVTILDCPALVICGIKAYRASDSGLESVGVIWAPKLSPDLKRKTRIPKQPNSEKKIAELEKIIDNLTDIRLIVCTKPRESGIGKKRPELFELPLGGEVKQKFAWAKEKLGAELKIADIFGESDWVDVAAVSKGKGFAGPVKRFGVRIRSRKNEKKRRHIGSLGPVNVARVLPGKLAMAGQLGFQTRTEWNKRILKLGTDGLKIKGGLLKYGNVPGDYALLTGSVPGAKKRLILLKPATRRVPSKEKIELKKVLLNSQQGL